jgi:hypothetical protein
MPTSPERYGLTSSASELVALRSAHAKHFSLDGSRRVAVLQHNLHYQDSNGDWDDVDLSFVAEGTDHVVRKHMVNSRVSGTWPGIELWERATGKGIRFMLPGRPQVVAAQKARFGKDDLTWTHTTRRSGVKLEALVTARQGQRAFKFPFQLLGGAASLKLDAGGNLVSDAFSLPQPYAIGADGQVYLCAKWELGPGNQAVLVLDDRAVPDAAFPYVLDPSTTFTVAASGDDAHTYSDAGASYPPAYSGVNTDETYISALKYLNGGKYFIHCAHVRWDTSSLSGKTVTGATFRARGTNKWDENSRNLVADWNAATWPLGSAAWTDTVGTDALDVDLTTISATGYNSLTLSNPASINTAGYTSLRFGISGGAPPGLNNIRFASYDNTSGYDPPQLIAEYSEPPSGGSEVTVTISAEGAGSKAGQGSAEVTIRVSAEGAGSKAGQGGSEAIVAVSGEGAGQKTTQGSSEVTVAVSAEGSGAKAAQGSSESAVAVSAEGSGIKAAQGSAEATAIISAEGAGVKHAEGGAEVTVRVSAEGLGGKYVEGSAEVTVIVGAEGAGQKRAEGSSEVTVTVSAEGSGTAARQGASEVTVTISAEGTGQKHAQNGVEATVTVSAEASGTKGGQGASEVTIRVSAEGQGSKAGQGSGESSVLISADGTGQGVKQGGVEATAAVSAEGTGSKSTQGSAEVTVVISVEGGGGRYAEGSAEVTVAISAEGAGIKGGQGGAEVTVRVSAEGIGVATFGPGIPTIIFTVRAEAGFTVARESTTFTVPTEATLLRRG